MKKLNFKELGVDYLMSLIAGLLSGFGLYYFSQHNGFVPGGISGLAFILSWFTKPEYSGIFIFLFNIPLCILLSIFVERKHGLNLAFYVMIQSSSLVLFEKVMPLIFPENPYYVAESGNLIFASIGAGCISGLGYGIQLRRNGSSGGTYAISALIKHWNPAANIAWLSFMMDCSVIFLVFFLAEFSIDRTLATIINLFLANFVVDHCLQGSKVGYKFEIITDNPEDLATEIMTTLKHGVTEMNVQGMYTHHNKYMIVCIVRKRDISKMMKILKKYTGTFSSFSKVNEVIGNFKK